MLQFEETKNALGIGMQPVANAGFELPASYVTAEAAAASVRMVAPAVVVSTSVPDSHRRIRVEDKRIINGNTDVNQLVPF